MAAKRRRLVLKQDPEDFFVEELTEVQAGPRGSFALYRLEKTGWTTVDALQAVGRRWQIDLRRMSYGGFKDRHAHTIQHFTVWRGPQRNLTHQRIAVSYLGQVEKPFSAEHIHRNRFRLAVRALAAKAVAAAQAAQEELSLVGVPNYFDDQRFGSVASPGRGFVAKELLRGNWEEALRLALLAPYEHDRAAGKKEKSLLRRHWNDWQTLHQILPRGHARRLADFLCHHPGDFRGAVQRLRPELRGLYLSAYQSHLWNRLLARWLETQQDRADLAWITLKLGRYPAPRRFADGALEPWRRLELPLPSGRLILDPADPRKTLLDAVLAEEKVTLDQFKLKDLKTMFFSSGERAAAFWPEGLHVETAADENHPGKQKLHLAFALPRGCYATMVVKRLLQVENK